MSAVKRQNTEKTKKRYYLGLASRIKNWRAHVFCRGRESDVEALEEALASKYGGKALAVKNGRSALTMALKAYFNSGDKVIVNGFTCYAVVEAVRAAGLKIVYADINRDDLNPDIETLEAVVDDDCAGILVQNSLGNMVDMRAIERFAGKHGLLIIEDLAHSAGRKYPDGREAGTVGMATVLSFGKDKAIETVSGGAVVFRYPYKRETRAPEMLPDWSDRLRARFYPMFAAWCKTLNYLHLGGVLMRILLRIHFVERSADNALDLTRKIAPFEAKLALSQLSELQDHVLRRFYLVNNREAVLAELRKNGFYFDGFWYEKPISPERYYKNVNFPEDKCPVATEVAAQIINAPGDLPDAAVRRVEEIVRPFMTTEDHSTERKK